MSHVPLYEMSKEEMDTATYAHAKIKLPAEHVPPPEKKKDGIWYAESQYVWNEQMLDKLPPPEAKKPTKWPEFVDMIVEKRMSYLKKHGTAVVRKVRVRESGRLVQKKVRSLVFGEPKRGRKKVRVVEQDTPAKPQKKRKGTKLMARIPKRSRKKKARKPLIIPKRTLQIQSIPKSDPTRKRKMAFLSIPKKHQPRASFPLTLQQTIKEYKVTEPEPPDIVRDKKLMVEQFRRDLSKLRILPVRADTLVNILSKFRAEELKKYAFKVVDRLKVSRVRIAYNEDKLTCEQIIVRSLRDLKGELDRHKPRLDLVEKLGVAVGRAAEEKLFERWKAQRKLSYPDFVSVYLTYLTQNSSLQAMLSLRSSPITALTSLKVEDLKKQLRVDPSKRKKKLTKSEAQEEETKQEEMKEEVEVVLPLITSPPPASPPHSEEPPASVTKSPKKKKKKKKKDSPKKKKKRSPKKKQKNSVTFAEVPVVVGPPLVVWRGKLHFDHNDLKTVFEAEFTLVSGKERYFAHFKPDITINGSLPCKKIANHIAKCRNCTSKREEVWFQVNANQNSANMVRFLQKHKRGAVIKSHSMRVYLFESREGHTIEKLMRSPTAPSGNFWGVAILDRVAQKRLGRVKELSPPTKTPVTSLAKLLAKSAEDEDQFFSSDEEMLLLKRGQENRESKSQSVPTVVKASDLDKPPTPPQVVSPSSGSKPKLSGDIMYQNLGNDKGGSFQWEDPMAPEKYDPSREPKDLQFTYAIPSSTDLTHSQDSETTASVADPDLIRKRILSQTYTTVDCSTNSSDSESFFDETFDEQEGEDTKEPEAALTSSFSPQQPQPPPNSSPSAKALRNRILGETYGPAGARPIIHHDPIPITPDKHVPVRVQKKLEKDPSQIQSQIVSHHRGHSPSRFIVTPPSPKSPTYHPPKPEASSSSSFYRKPPKLTAEEQRKYDKRSVLHSDGSWTCGRCRFQTNFSDRSTCYKCFLPKPAFSRQRHFHPRHGRGLPEKRRGSSYHRDRNYSRRSGYGHGKGEDKDDRQFGYQRGQRQDSSGQQRRSSFQSGYGRGKRGGSSERRSRDYW